MKLDPKDLPYIKATGHQARLLRCETLNTIAFMDDSVAIAPDVLLKSACDHASKEVQAATLLQDAVAVIEGWEEDSADKVREIKQWLVKWLTEEPK
jgi:hypothetical protein